MKICVCGWYYYPEFYRCLEEVHHIYPVTVIAHRPNTISNLPTVERENAGLEWGAYNHYLMNVWNGDSVLFTHDDTIIIDTNVFDKISKLTLDCTFIFRDTQEAEANIYIHGRAVLMSERYLLFCKESGGFWYDKENHGENYREDGSHNEGSRKMHDFIYKHINIFDLNFATYQEYFTGYRGSIGIDGLMVESFNLGYSTTKRKTKEWIRKLEFSEYGGI